MATSKAQLIEVR